MREKLLTIDEVANEFSVTRWTIWNWRKQGYIKAHGIGRRIYFKQEDVEKALIELSPLK